MRSASKRISKSFIVILILLGVLIACFIFKYYTRTKPTFTAVTPAVAEIHPHKKHKRKHKFKKYIAGISSITKMDTAKAAPPRSVLSKPVVATVATAPTKAVTTPPLTSVIKQVTVTPIAVSKPQPVKIAQDTVKAIKINNTFPYATYIHANITGIVKMRINDQYNSGTVADIPGNSKVLVLAKGPTYYRVSYNNNVGFIPKWALKDK